MPGTAIAKRYAQAIAQIAQEQGSWDQWVEDLRLLSRLVQETAFRQAMESPKLPQAEKFAFLDQHVTNARPLARQLTKLLVMKRRISILPELADAFQLLVDAHRGLEHVNLVTAVPLEPEDEVALKARLEAYTGKQVALTTEVDPTIIGGVVIRIGDKLIDGSTQGRLQALRRQLAGVR